MERFKYDSGIFLQILYARFILLFVYVYSYVGFKICALNKAYCIVLFSPAMDNQRLFQETIYSKQTNKQKRQII